MRSRKHAELFSDESLDVDWWVHALSKSVSKGRGNSQVYRYFYKGVKPWPLLLESTCIHYWVMSSNFGHILLSLPFPFIFQYTNIFPKSTQPLNIFVQILALAVSQWGLNHVHAEVIVVMAVMWAEPACLQKDLCPFFLSSWEGIPWNQYCGILH